MGLFGIGGSKSKSEQTQYSESQSSSFDVSGSEQRSGQTVFGAGTYKDLYAGAGSVAGSIAQDGFLSQAAMSMYDSGSGFLNQIAGLQGGEEQQYLAGVMRGEGDGNVAEQKSVLQEDLGRFFKEELLTGIAGNSVMAGNLGGSRQGIAQVGAAREVAGQFRRGALDIDMAAQARRDQAARDLYGMKEGTAALGMQASQQGMDMATQASLAPLAPYAALGEILGGPTTLTSSYGSSYGVGGSQSSSRAEGKSTSKSKSFSFGF